MQEITKGSTLLSYFFRLLFQAELWIKRFPDLRIDKYISKSPANPWINWPGLDGLDGMEQYFNDTVHHLLAIYWI